MKKVKKGLSLVLTLIMLVAIVPLEAHGANAYVINGKTVRYTDFSSSPNDCWNYANNIYNKIWGQKFSNSFSDSNNSLRNLSDSQLLLNTTNLKNYVSHAALGSCLRICNSDYLHGTDGWGHSQIIVQKDANGFTVFEGGLSASPYKREKYYTWSEYCSTGWLGGTYKYIKYIKWPGASAYSDTSQQPTKIIYPTNGAVYKIASGVGNNMYLAFALSNDNVQIYENTDSNTAADWVKSQYYKITHVSDGWYTIVGMESGKAMDVYDWCTASGTNISQYSLHGGDNQLFRFYDAGNGYCYIKSKLGTYVDVQNGDSANRTNVWAYDFNGSNAQKWKLQSHSHSYTSKITTAATCTKTGVKTFTCKCGASYTESIAKTAHVNKNNDTKCDVCNYILVNEPTKILYPTNNSIVKISTAIDSNKFLSFDLSSTNIYIYDNLDNHSDASYVKSQYFKLTHLSDGWYIITNTGNDKVVDVEDWKATPGTNISQYPVHGGTNQVYRFYDAGNGYVYIKSKLGTYVDVANAQNANKANVRAYSFNGTNAEKWKLETHSHSYTSKVTTAATCTKTGVKTFTCKCGASYTEKINATTSTHTYKTTTTKATLSKNGKSVTKCTTCGYVKSTKTIYMPKTIKLSSSTVTYNGKTRTPSVTVKDSKGNTLKKDTDFTVKYASGRKMPGKYTITVTFKGKYSGTKKLTFTIKPAVPKISKVTSTTKGKANIYWSNVTGASGYAFYYSTSKNGTYTHFANYKAGSKVSTKNSLKSGKTYYFKVKAYTKTSSGWIYSSASEAKSVKIK